MQNHHIEQGGHHYKLTFNKKILMKQMHFDGVKLIYLCCTDLIASGFGELYEPYETGVTRGFPKP